jgi:hypothetical protein
LSGANKTANNSESMELNNSSTFPTYMWFIW